MKKIKNLNDILKLKPHVLKTPTDEEILEAFSKPYKTNVDFFITSIEGAEILKGIFIEYEKNNDDNEKP